MTVYVIRDGKLVPKSTAEPQDFAKSANFPSPRVSRIEAYESPVTGKEITSWRERDRDMKAADAFDYRDLPKDHKFTKGRAAQLEAAQGKQDDGGTEFEWR